MESQKGSSGREHVFRVPGSFWRYTLFLIKLLICQNYRKFLEYLHIVRSISTSLLTLHLPVKPIFPPKVFLSDFVSEFLGVKCSYRGFFSNTLLLSPYTLQMLKQPMNHTGLLLILGDIFLQKRKLCFSNNIGFLLLRSPSFLLSNLGISRLAIPKPSFSVRKRRHLHSDLTKTIVFHSCCHRILEWLGLEETLTTTWFQPRRPETGTSPAGSGCSKAQSKVAWDNSRAGVRGGQFCLTCHDF